MKIGPASGIDSISNRMSVARINDGEKKKTPISTPGYKSNQLKLILKFRKFVRDYDVTEDDGNEREGYTSEDRADYENDSPGVFDTVTNILFSNDISDGMRIRETELLAELSKYQGEGEAISRKIHLNKNNIGLFVEILSELIENNLYFGRDIADDKALGSIIDFRV